MEREKEIIWRLCRCLQFQSIWLKSSDSQISLVHFDKSEKNHFNARALAKLVLLNKFISCFSSRTCSVRQHSTKVALELLTYQPLFESRHSRARNVCLEYCMLKETLLRQREKRTEPGGIRNNDLLITMWMLFRCAPTTAQNTTKTNNPIVLKKVWKKLKILGRWEKRHPTERLEKSLKD